MKRLIHTVVVLAWLGVLQEPFPALAQTVRYVDNIQACGGLDPCYPTIMDAVSAAAAFDTIAVFPGVYQESVTFSSHPGHVVLRAHVGGLKPVIRAPSADAVQIILSPGIQVSGFVIEAPGGTGIFVASGGSHDYVIQDNLITASSNGVRASAVSGGTVRGNTLIGSGIAGDFQRAVIEENTLVDAGISLADISQPTSNNTVRHNVVRGGAISLSGGRACGNTIESNFVSGGQGIWISVSTFSCFDNRFQDNTSIENASCDIDDRTSPPFHNVWVSNRFGTKCGGASE